ncbi:MAG: rhomboid family intramembrane serine protease [Thermonema sp.]|jgi:membrane associated rhomboid family serine protease|uniref:rhomboid family intramembrane serine protease n=1 Tax=Thermonema TaxID=28194 RepID=UPI0005704012|nr:MULTISPECIES: rhomboid family intramembrane serine protease [Thermonema]GIV39779.1 MAG: rhomboid family intramembrane serine protease [Thermonema sp.]
MLNRVPPITLALLASNLLMYFVYHYTPLGNAQLLELYPFQSSLFRPHQLFSYMFLHANFWHLFGNMFGLYVFGALLEQVLGDKRYLILYLVCGIGAGVAQNGVRYWEYKDLQNDKIAFLSEPTPAQFRAYIEEHVGKEEELNPAFVEFMHAYERNPENSSYIATAKQYARSIAQQQSEVPTVGASGAIFGIIMAFALLFPNLRMMLLIPPIPIKAKYLALLYAGFELYSLIQSNPNDNIAHFAHLSGMIFAYLLIKYWRVPQYH